MQRPDRTGENWKDFWSYVTIFAVCTFVVEVFYILIFVIRYRQTRPSVRGKGRAHHGNLEEFEEWENDDAYANSEYPDFWTRFNQNADGGFKLVEIGSDSEEYNYVASMFGATVTKRIVRIERIQNKLLWNRYYDCMKRMHEDNDGVTNEMTLFHGTKALNPEEIYKGDEGFDMRFSKEGMWGCGNYFAVKASYSDGGYSHRCTDGCSQLLVASVLTGHQFTCPSDTSLRKPPIRDNNAAIKRRYDCVSGDTGSSKIFITYDNARAYPTYLITYK